MNTTGKKILWGLMAFFAVGITIFVIGQYAPGNPDRYFPDQRTIYIAHRTALMTHILGGSLALLIGPFQFLPAMRRKRSLGWHRWLGRLYLVGILVGGLAGLYMATFSHGGLITHIGFGMLALLWLITGTMAYLRIRVRDIKAHERWMKRSFALTFAAVTLRIWLPLLAFALGLEFTRAYQMSAWLAWVPNLLVAEWLIHRQQNRAPSPALAGTTTD
ncbi:MAG: DUF2306 domain-containing protein [Ardenticatenaceae bacterium]|nr:DUF2306 domain-containing protein [Ardenticatenaceae bacterium]